MDFPKRIDTICMELYIFYFNGSHVEISINRESYMSAHVYWIYETSWRKEIKCEVLLLTLRLLWNLISAMKIWKVKSDIIQCIHLCFCMLAISFYFVNCVIISCKLSFNSRFTRNQIPIMSFLGFKKAELGCKMSELHLYVVKRQNWVVIIWKWICFSILTPEGAPILLGINNFSHASRTRCKRC